MNVEKSLTGQNCDTTMYGTEITTAVTKSKFTQIDVQQKRSSNGDTNCLAKIDVLHYYEESNARRFFKCENI